MLCGLYITYPHETNNNFAAFLRENTEIIVYLDIQIVFDSYYEHGIGFMSLREIDCSNLVAMLGADPGLYSQNDIHNNPDLHTLHMPIGDEETCSNVGIILLNFDRPLSELVSGILHAGTGMHARRLTGFFLISAVYQYNAPPDYHLQRQVLDPILRNRVLDSLNG